MMGLVGSEETNQPVGNRVQQFNMKRRLTIYNESRQKRSQDKQLSLVYYMRGQKICRKAFSHLVGLKDRTICLHAKEVTMEPKLLLYKPRLGESHAGKHGVHRHTVDEYLNYV